MLFNESFIESIVSKRKPSKQYIAACEKKAKQSFRVLAKLNQSSNLKSYIKFFPKESLSRLPDNSAMEIWLNREIHFIFEDMVRVHSEDNIPVEWTPFPYEKTTETLLSMLEDEYDKPSRKHTIDEIYQGLFAIAFLYHGLARHPVVIRHEINEKFDIARAWLFYLAGTFIQDNIEEVYCKFGDIKRGEKITAGRLEHGGHDKTISEILELFAECKRQGNTFWQHLPRATAARETKRLLMARLSEKDRTKNPYQCESTIKRYIFKEIKTQRPDLF